ncbi:MAG: histidine phosphatase family protein [Erysipelotrichaceae bacterium]|nr:histidine phosphatase family protein [Erysipelotrichaceae bacterium]
MAITFYYVRHGETIFNVTGRSQGACDSPLTELGISQAKQTAEKLKDIDFDRAYSSSSERAVDTAELILEGRNIPLVRLKGLREMCFGLLEGSNLNDGDEMRECWVRKDFTAFGGENKEQLIERIRITFNRILEDCKDDDKVLIVSHRGYFFYMLEALFGQNMDELERKDPQILEHLIPNASVGIFEYDGKWKLLRLPQ